jgi:hypothetical protein
MSQQGQYFLFLLGQVFSCNCVTPFLFILFALAVIKNYWIDKTPYRAVHLLALFPFLFPIWMLIWGTLFEHTTSGPPGWNEVPEWQFFPLRVIVAIQLLITIGCFIYFKGLRLSILTLALWQGFLTFLSLLVAGMSIGGTWL